VHFLASSKRERRQAWPRPVCRGGTWGREPDAARAKQPAAERALVSQPEPIDRREMGKAVKYSGLVFAGILIGCAAATVAPPLSSRAQPAQGQWACFRIDEFPDIEEASEWKPARNMAMSLGRVAPHTPPGTIFNAYWNEKNSITCVKY
jgi:hypothetical protein